jgi:hypothetical protein
MSSTIVDRARIKFYTLFPNAHAGITLPLSLVLLFAAYLGYSWLQRHLRRRRMPPGPDGFLWYGNRHQVPSIKPWRTFAQWTRIYGTSWSMR